MPASEIEYLVTSRSKRSTAGNRLKALLDQEVEKDEIFQEVEDDIDFEAQDEADIVDSDFDNSSEDGEGNDEEEGESVLEMEEKAHKKAKAVPLHAKRPAVRPPTAEKEMKRPRTSFAQEISTPSSSGGKVRTSSRSATVANKLQVEEKLREAQVRRAALPVRTAPKKKPSLTQDALIAEALETEETNRESLKRFMVQEEERRAKLRMRKERIQGPFVRWVSVAMRSRAREEIKVQQVEQQQDLTKDPAVEAREKAKQERRQAEAPQPQKEEATLTRHARTFLSVERTPEGWDWLNDFQVLLGTHCEWDAVPYVPARNRPLRPRQSICPITGLPAIYKDPRTGIPYANKEAYSIITQLLHNKYVWTGGREGGGTGAAPLGMGVYVQKEDEVGAAEVFKDIKKMEQVKGKEPVKAGYKRGWAPSIAPGDESSIMAAAAQLPAGSTRSGRRVSRRH